MKSHTDLEARQNHHFGRLSLAAQKSAIDKLAMFFAGSRTHEDGLVDFLLFRASTDPEISRKWKWSIGEAVPSGSSPHQLTSLPTALTEVPDELMCPISHGLLTEAVKASDGHTYSRSAIERWFAVGRKSSPMHGLELADTHLTANEAVSDKAQDWIDATDILPVPVAPDAIKFTLGSLKLTFVSRDGSFSRTIPKSWSINELYQVAFRGLKARVQIFQLVRANGDRLLPSLTTADSRGVKSGDRITIRIADEADLGVSGSGSAMATASAEMVLIKVYDNSTQMRFSYWIGKDTTCTLESIMWRYWRYQFANNSSPTVKERQVWTDMESSGDGLLSGTPRDASCSLADLLTPEHCFGRLTAEPVYCQDDTSNLLFTRPESQQPLVLKVKINEVWAKTQKKESVKLTRLDVLKQMFEALINRLIAYNFNSHCGLISFAETATVAQPISHVLENFRKAVSRLHASGDTALWDALALGRDQIQQYASRYPNAKKRIIVLSDGEDTKSTSNQAHDVAFAMMQNDIAVDSISLGGDDNLDLRTLSSQLGCYRFHPMSLESAMMICELEPVLALAQRPPIVLPPSIPRTKVQYTSRFANARYQVTITPATANDYPAGKVHPNLSDSFVQLTTMHARRSTSSSQPSGSRTNLRTNRIMSEINRILTVSADRGYDVYVSESDMSFWKIFLSGPEGTPYSEGTFLLYLSMGESFPTHPCEVRFVTKIKHPNINAHGRVCHALLSRDWTSDVSLTTVLDTVYGLMLQAEISDSISTTATLGYHHDQLEYNEEVQEFCRRHASKTAAQWRRELIGE